jgi:hypothetical protein
VAGIRNVAPLLCRSSCSNCDAAIGSSEMNITCDRCRMSGFRQDSAVGDHMLLLSCQQSDHMSPSYCSPRTAANMHLLVYELVLCNWYRCITHIQLIAKPIVCQTSCCTRCSNAKHRSSCMPLPAAAMPSFITYDRLHLVSSRTHGHVMTPTDRHWRATAAAAAPAAAATTNHPYPHSQD